MADGRDAKWAGPKGKFGREIASRNRAMVAEFNRDITARGSKARKIAASKLAKVRKQNKSARASGREVIPF